MGKSLFSVAALIAMLACPWTVAAAPSAVDVTYGKGGTSVISFAPPPSTFDPDPDEDYPIVRSTTAGVVVLRRSSVAPFGVVVQRVTTSGAPDPAWGTAGVAALPAGYVWTSMLTSSDGGLRIVGADVNDRIAILALDVTGARLGGWGADGLAGTGVQLRELDATIDHLDRVVIGGCHVPAGGAQDCDSSIVRISTSGQLDGSFGTGGMWILDRDPGVGDGIERVVAGEDGSIYATLWSNSDDAFRQAVLHLTSGGSFDASFGSSGHILLAKALYFDASALALGAGDRILLRVSAYRDANDAIRAYTSRGVLDTSWGVSGIKPLRISGYGRSFSDEFVTDADGRTYFLGYGGADELIGRLTPGGRFDSAWGRGGVAFFDPTPLGRGSLGAEDLTSVETDSTGRALLIFEFPHGVKVVRLANSPATAAIPTVSVAPTCVRCVRPAGVRVRVSGAVVGTPIVLRIDPIPSLISGMELPPPLPVITRIARVDSDGAATFPNVLLPSNRRAYGLFARVAAGSSHPSSWVSRRVVVRPR